MSILFISGTIICPATDCFVHWRDPWYDCEWGLNFTSAPDARKFRDCCSVSITTLHLFRLFYCSCFLPPLRYHGKNFNLGEIRQDISSLILHPPQPRTSNCQQMIYIICMSLFVMFS